MTVLVTTLALALIAAPAPARRRDAPAPRVRGQPRARVFMRSDRARRKGVLGGQVGLGTPLGGVPLPEFGVFVALVVF